MTEAKAFWGPSVWKTLHSFAAAYSPEDADAFLTFVYDVLPNLLPCEWCQINFKKKLAVLPPHPYLGSNHDLFFWTYIVHDLANKAITEYVYDSIKKGKKPDNTAKSSPPYVEVKMLYFTKMKGCRGCKVEI